MSLTDLIPEQYRIAALAGGAVLIVVLAGGAGWWVNGWRWDAKLQGVQAEWAVEREGLAERAQAAEAAQREIEQKRQVAIAEAVEDGQKQTESARADAADARERADSLQQQFELSERRSRACGNSLTAQLSEAADNAARVRADVFGRCATAVQRYAAIADERGIAGSVCAATYGSLIQK